MGISFCEDTFFTFIWEFAYISNCKDLIFLKLIPYVFHTIMVVRYHRQYLTLFSKFLQIVTALANLPKFLEIKDTQPLKNTGRSCWYKKSESWLRQPSRVAVLISHFHMQQNWAVVSCSTPKCYSSFSFLWYFKLLSKHLDKYLWCCFNLAPCMLK